MPAHTDVKPTNMLERCFASAFAVSEDTPRFVRDSTDVKPTNMREGCFAVPGNHVFQCETIDYSKCKPQSMFGPFVVRISTV